MSAKQKATNKRRQNGKQPAQESQEMEPPETPTEESQAMPAPSSSSGKRSSETSRLLTSLKYQVQKKKASAAHRQAAQEILDKYATAGNAAEKWALLEEVSQHGVEQLSTWHHFRNERQAKKEIDSTETLEGMFTMGQILQAAGIVARDLTEEEQVQTLEDLLKESEDLYGHARNTVAHPANPRLTRHYYRWAKGRQRRSEVEDSKEWESKGEVTQLKELLPPDAPSEALPTQSAGYKAWTSLGTRLKKQKQKLTSVEDQLATCVANLRDSQEARADENMASVLAEQTKIREALMELREHLGLGNAAASLNIDKLGECAEGIALRTELEAKCERARREATSAAEISKLAWRRS